MYASDSTTSTSPGRPESPALDGDALWSAFVTADNAADFCRNWLALQCLQVCDVRGALLLLAQEGATFVPAAVWPSAQFDAAYLAPAAQQCLTERRGLILRGQTGAVVLVAYPLEVGDQLQGAVVLDVAERPESQLQTALRQLHWGVGWLESLVLRRTVQQDAQSLARARLAMDMLAVAAEHARLSELGIALVNELASRFHCDRVSMGVDRSGRAQLVALSHSAAFEKRSQFVAALENAMEEALDQRCSIVWPPLSDQVGESRTSVAIAHRDLAPQRAVCSVLLASRGKGIGVLSFERGVDAPFSADEVRGLETIGVLLGPLVEGRIQLHRWIAGRLADWVADTWQLFRDPRRPAFGAALGAVALLLIAALTVEGEYRVNAKAVIEGEIQRAVVAPFEGFIRAAPVRAGMTVRLGQTMATLDDRDLQLERRRWLAEREQHERRYRDALSKHERANAQIALSQQAESQSQLALVEEKLSRASVQAPFDGVVVSGDLTQLMGSPVERGKQLFEVAPLDAYRVILKVDDRDIRHVRAGLRGQLVLTGLARDPMGFVVQNIAIAQAEEGKNLFRVEATLDPGEVTLRPGMEGVGKIAVGERSYAWIWTHRLLDWLRLQAWAWSP